MRVLVKFAEGTIVPLVLGATPDLPLAEAAAWAQLLATFEFLTLEPVVTDVGELDLATMVDEAATASPGEVISNPALVFAVAIPDAASPDPSTVADMVIGALNLLPFVEFALLEQDLVAAVDRGQNPAALFQRYLNPAPVGIDADAAWGVSGGDGAGVTVGVLEPFDYDRLHQDAPALRLDLTPNLGVPGDLALDHATAIVGIIAAADNQNDCVGIVPAARVVFASGQNLNASGTIRVGDAFSLLMLLGVQLRAGDLINVSSDIGLNLPPGPARGVSIDADPVIRSAIRLLTSRGVACVIAAGNGSFDLDTSPLPIPDSGAIVVGGIEPTNPQATTFARHGVSDFGAHVDCCAWASDVTTLTTPLGPGGSTTQVFASASGGTSLSTAIVSGVVAAIQGIARARNGQPMTPSSVRSLLRTVALGSDVVPGQAVGAMPDLAKIVPQI